MIWFIKGNYEKILVAFAAGVLVLSLGWTWRWQKGLQGPGKAINPGVPTTAQPYTPASWRMSVPGRVSWTKAPEQSAGSGWLYELFTPPVIHYDAGTRAFAVAAPRRAASRGAPATGRPATVAKPEPLRLQLTGYFGTPGNYLVVLVSSESGETLLARVGRRFPELGLILANFEVKKVPVEHGEPWPVYDVVGFATLRDEHTGTEVVLDTRAGKGRDNPGVPLVASPPTTGSTPVTIAGPGGVSSFPASSEPERGQ
jgi:hypothetical protein